MSKLTGKQLTADWQAAVSLVLGLWLIVSPFVLAFDAEQVPAVIAVVVGVIVAAAAAAALYAFQQWEEWGDGVLAAWLLGFGTLLLAMWSRVLTGRVIGILALWSATIGHGRGGIASKG